LLVEGLDIATQLQPNGIDLRVERDEARRFARRFRWLAFDGCDNGTSVFRQLGLDKLPDWFDAATPEPDLSNKPIGWIDA